MAPYAGDMADRRTVEVGAEDQGGAVRASVGDEIVVRLRENRTTGYRWVLEALDDEVVSAGGDGYEPDDRHVGNVGGGGWRAFRFEAARPGRTVLRLARRRPWEGTRPGENRFEVTVDVSGSGS